MTLRKYNGKTVFGLYTKYPLEDNVIECLDELCKMVDKRDEMIRNANDELLKRGCRISELTPARNDYIEACHYINNLKEELRACKEHFAVAKKELEGANNACINVCTRRDALATEVGDIRREKHALDKGLVKARADYDALKNELKCLKVANDKTDAENTRLCALDKNEMHRKYEELHAHHLEQVDSLNDTIDNMCKRTRDLQTLCDNQSKRLAEILDMIGGKEYTVTLHGDCISYTMW